MMSLAIPTDKGQRVEFYFADVFGVSEGSLEDHGAFNISLVTDLPLFIDPFLLFNSDKAEYQALHRDMIGYLRFLRDKSVRGQVSPSLLRAWYVFSEVKQNWLGFCTSGNAGRGLGAGFARALNRNLAHIFSSFGSERITRASHLEKLCLIRAGVGKDMISDFTMNLVKDYLLQYTQRFAQDHIAPRLRARFSVRRARFSYDTETWLPATYDLPVHEGDFVLLTPKDILTKDETWINRRDLVTRFRDVPDAIENTSLRAQINNYFYAQLSKKRQPTKEEYGKAVEATLRRYPELVDYFIKYKEDHGDEAVVTSLAKVIDSHRLYVAQFGELARLLASDTEFYRVAGNTAEEVRARIEFFKDVIENKGGHRFFYVDGQPVRRESDLHILFRLVWFATPSDVSREVNDGRGPADFKISRGSVDKTLVEFKLASNTRLARNLDKQVGVYQRASDAQTGYKVIVYFTEAELIRVERILEDLELKDDPRVYLVDARDDNKPSGSRA